MSPATGQGPVAGRPPGRRVIVSGVKFAISLPQECSDGAFDPAAFAAYARRANELGFDSAWTQ